VYGCSSRLFGVCCVSSCLWDGLISLPEEFHRLGLLRHKNKTFEFQTIDAYSNVRLSGEKYEKNKLSKFEN
jgi:hypothetical protein